MKNRFCTHQIGDKFFLNLDSALGYVTPTAATTKKPYGGSGIKAATYQADKGCLKTVDFIFFKSTVGLFLVATTLNVVNDQGTMLKDKLRLLQQVNSEFLLK
jgi:hypothetical protein